MDLPISLKPNFINMDLDFEHLNIFDVISNDRFDLNISEIIFGKNLDWDWIKKIFVDCSSNNNWIWGLLHFKLQLFLLSMFF